MELWSGLQSGDAVTGLVSVYALMSQFWPVIFAY